MPVKIKTTLEQKEPSYKKLAPKIKELKALGMTLDQIAKKLNVSIKTIRKSLVF
jgi:orotate phosphoribosyltransferase-like protein